MSVAKHILAHVHKMPVVTGLSTTGWTSSSSHEDPMWGPLVWAVTCTKNKLLCHQSSTIFGRWSIHYTVPWRCSSEWENEHTGRCFFRMHACKAAL